MGQDKKTHHFTIWWRNGSFSCLASSETSQGKN